MNRAQKPTTSVSTSSTYLNIAAFDNNAYPVGGDMSLDYFNESLMRSNDHNFSGMANVSPGYDAYPPISPYV